MTEEEKIYKWVKANHPEFLEDFNGVCRIDKYYDYGEKPERLDREYAVWHEKFPNYDIYILRQHTLPQSLTKDRVVEVRSGRIKLLTEKEIDDFVAQWIEETYVDGT